MLSDSEIVSVSGSEDEAVPYTAKVHEPVKVGSGAGATWENIFGANKDAKGRYPSEMFKKPPPNPVGRPKIKKPVGRPV